METKRASPVAAKLVAKRKSFVSQMDSVGPLKSNICKTIWTARKKAKKKRDLKRSKASKRAATLAKANQTYSKKKVSTLSRMVPFTAVSGLVASATASVNKHGQMEHAMKESGKTTRLMDVAFSIMSMVMSSMVSGVVIRPTASAPTIMLTVRNTRAAGSMIFRTEAAKRPGRMVLSTKAFTVKA